MISGNSISLISNTTSSKPMITLSLYAETTLVHNVFMPYGEGVADRMKYHPIGTDMKCPFCGRINLVYKRPGLSGDVYRCAAEFGGCEVAQPARLRINLDRKPAACATL